MLVQLHRINYLCVNLLCVVSWYMQSGKHHDKAVNSNKIKLKKEKKRKSDVNLGHKVGLIHASLDLDRKQTLVL